MPSAEDIKKRIEAAIPGASVEVEDYTGGGDHFSATVAAAAFDGLTRIQQHRLVYDIFGAEIGGAIHALALKTQAITGDEQPVMHAHPTTGQQQRPATIQTP